MTVSEETIREMVRRVVLRTIGQEAPASGGADPSHPPACQVPVVQRASITEADVLAMPAGAQIEVPAGALVTPLARDAAVERGIGISEGGIGAPSLERLGSPLRSGATENAGTQPGRASRTIALGADHGGFRLKEELKSVVAEWGYQVTDCGTFGTDPVDYPDYAYAVARLVADGRAWRGIVVDGAGIGSCMAANKVPGVRAAMCYDHTTAVNSREHNDANVLTLGGMLIGSNLARQIVKVWLETPFGGDRHARRVGKIADIEHRFLKKPSSVPR